MEKTKILIVDDHPAMRHGIAQLIEMEPDFEICGEAANRAQALSLIDTKQPDFVLLDISLEDKKHTGLDLIPEIQSKIGAVPVLVFSMHDELLYAERSLRAGARGYLMKQEPVSVLITAIRKILDGGIYLSEELNQALIMRLIGEKEESAEKSPEKSLTARELEIFNLIGTGMQPAEIAKKLFLSAKTIETHRFMIRRKLGFSRAADLIRFAIEWVHTKK